MRTNWIQNGLERAVDAFTKTLLQLKPDLDRTTVESFADLMPHPPVRSEILVAARGIASRIGHECNTDAVLEAAAAYYGVRDWNALSAVSNDIATAPTRPGPERGIIHVMNVTARQRLAGGTDIPNVITIEDPPEFMRKPTTIMYRNHEDGRLLEFVRYDARRKEVILQVQQHDIEWNRQLPMDPNASDIRDESLNIFVPLAEISRWSIVAQDTTQRSKSAHLPFLVAGLPDTLRWDGGDADVDGHVVISRKKYGRVLTNLPVGEVPRHLLLAAENAAEAAALAAIALNGDCFRYLKEKDDWQMQLRSAGAKFARAFMPEMHETRRIPIGDVYDWLENGEGTWWRRACTAPSGTEFA